jgi:hypothetical protein
MRDLLLWRRLDAAPGKAEPPEDPTTEALLLELSAQPLGARAPLLGRVSRWLPEADPPGRVAALRALAGATGITAIRTIVARLDDEDATVRLAAVAALAESASQQPARWAHAIFHPRVDVRAAALATEAPAAAAHFGVYLRADPDPANAAAARDAPWPKGAVRLVLDLHARGLVSTDECAQRVVEAPPGGLRSFVRMSVRRRPADVHPVVAALEAGAPPPPPAGHDVLDQLLAIAIEAGAEGAGPALSRAVGAIVLANQDRLLRRRFVAALAADLVSGRATPELVAIAVACQPGLLGSASLPVEVRRRGVGGLATYRDNLGRVDRALVETLLDGDLPRRASGEIDLETIARLAALLAERRVRTVTDRFGHRVILDAAITEIPAWRAVCEGPEGLAEWILKSARRFRADALPRLRAVAVCTWAAESNKARYEMVLADIPGKSAGPVMLELLALSDAGELVLSSKILERVAPELAKRAAPTELLPILSQMLQRSMEPPGEVGLTLMVQVARRPSDARLSSTIAKWSDEELHRLVRFADEYRVLRHDKEQIVAAALMHHADPALRDWATRVVASATVAMTESPRAGADTRVLTRAERERIAMCPEGELRAALAPALEAPARGVAEALGLRSGAPRPHVWACVALVGAVDAPAEVSAQLDRYHHDDEDFSDAVRRAVLANWESNRGVGPFGHAWLHRWEAHAFALLAWFDESPAKLAGWLVASVGFRGALGRRVWWQAAASVVVLRGYREPAGLTQFATEALVDVLVDALDTELGEFAARMLVALSRTRTLPLPAAALTERIHEVAPDVDKATRFQLSRLVTLDGLPARTVAAREIMVRETDEEFARIRTSEDLDLLEHACAVGSPRFVHEAALRLIELGAAGQSRLAGLLERRPRVRSVRTLIESIPLWSDDDALERARRRFDDAETTLVERLCIALSFAERGEAGWAARAIDVVATPADHVWFQREDWLALVTRVDSVRALCVRVVGGDQPHAYRPALAWLLDRPELDDEVAGALRAFLDCGTDRPSNMRHQAATRLHAEGDAFALPVAVAAAVGDATAPEWLFEGAGRKSAPVIVDVVLDAVALVGNEIWSEARAIELVRLPNLDGRTRRHALRRLLVEASTPGVRTQVVELLGPSLERDAKLMRVAEIFAWGVRRGRELTGRIFRVHMTTKRHDLGFTRFSANRVFVSPLPVLTGERYGRDVVEALVLHELGHHMYHAGEGDAAVWSRAQGEGLHSLLNLVADEHLERNLRAIEAKFGDRLKRLAAYAFQHSERETPVPHLLSMLLGAALPVLSSRALGVAFKEDCVVVQRGFLLRELERVGQPFARFVRALRMGLGDRHGDPTLQEALELFKGRFRHHDMEGLYQVTLRLAELYGGAAQLAEQFGGHEGLDWDEREGSIHGDGINDDDVQREVERILDPRQLKRTKEGDGPPSKLAVNVNPDARFDLIQTIEKVPPDPAAHRAVAMEVRRASDRLREYLARLGLAMVPARGRLRGRAFDRTRTQAVVIRRDPRMLVARETKIETDLFIGIAVDCSGSMQVGTSMTKAHRFGVLIAEAVKGMKGVDARFFGFTDRVIYDAGDATHCAVTSLRPGGGNNDAAALHHVAKVALNSRRKAKLLVMISDGLPTECSVAALRNLVSELTRRKGICCAQVAVRPLAEACFPHHIVLSKEDIETSTRRFGEVVSRLVRQAIGR